MVLVIQEIPTYEEFCAAFETESSCEQAMFKVRWPHGFRCPKCNHSDYYLTATRRLPLYECISCRTQTSAISGTIMQGSRTSLCSWFKAIYLLSQPAGISALCLSEIIDVTYKTAWLIAHKIRHAMEQSEISDTLSGFVHVDRIYYGRAEFRDARHPLVIGGSFVQADNLQHIHISQPDPTHVQNESRAILKPAFSAFVHQNVDKNATVNLNLRGVRHPRLNQIGHNLNRWLNNTFQGIGAKHLQRYLHEFCFRMNLALRDTSVLKTLLQFCVTTPTLVYKNLIVDKPTLPVPWLVWGSKGKWKGRLLTLWNG